MLVKLTSESEQWAFHEDVIELSFLLKQKSKSEQT